MYWVSVPKINVVVSYKTIIPLLEWKLFQSKRIKCMFGYFPKVWYILINFVEFFGCIYKEIPPLRHPVVNYQITALK